MKRLELGLLLLLPLVIAIVAGLLIGGVELFPKEVERAVVVSHSTDDDFHSDPNATHVYEVQIPTGPNTYITRTVPEEIYDQYYRGR